MLILLLLFFVVIVITIIEIFSLQTGSRFGVWHSMLTLLLFLVFVAVNSKFLFQLLHFCSLDSCWLMLLFLLSSSQSLKYFLADWLSVWCVAFYVDFGHVVVVVVVTVN